LMDQHISSLSIDIISYNKTINVILFHNPIMTI
jgi:hypothetical protein